MLLCTGEYVNNCCIVESTSSIVRYFFKIILCVIECWYYHSKRLIRLCIRLINVLSFHDLDSTWNWKHSGYCRLFPVQLTIARKICATMYLFFFSGVTQKAVFSSRCGLQLSNPDNPSWHTYDDSCIFPPSAKSPQGWLRRSPRRTAECFVITFQLASPGCGIRGGWN